MSACDFCGEEHPNGVSQAMIDRGHPYLTGGGSEARGFVYRVKGRDKALTRDEYEAARKAWQERAVAVAEHAERLATPGPGQAAALDIMLSLAGSRIVGKQ
jgi:hypothetical protein